MHSFPSCSYSSEPIGEAFNDLTTSYLCSINRFEISIVLQGLHVATLCRLTTLAALVYSAVQSAILLVDTFDLLRDWQYSDTRSPKAFDIVYFVTLMLLLLSAFLAIFGIIFYRAYLTVSVVQL